MSIPKSEWLRRHAARLFALGVPADQTAIQSQIDWDMYVHHATGRDEIASPEKFADAAFPLINLSKDGA